MPEIFPSWMMSPVVMYGVPGVILFLMLAFIIARAWRMLTLLIVILVIGGTAFMGFFWKTINDFMASFPMPTPGIVAQTVTLRNFDDRIESVGTAQANESTSLSSNVSETVKEILFTEGQYVTAGTVIARLDDSEERANLIEAQKSFNRAVELVRTQAVSTARLDADRARLDIAKVQIADRQIVAPFDGVLGLRSISVGDIVNPGMVITTLDDTDPIKLEFSVPETYVSAIDPDLPIEARAEAWPGQIFKGFIRAIDPRVDPVTRAFRVKAEIPNGDGKIRPGMLMRVDVVKEIRTALAISEEALLSKGDQKSVYVLGETNKDGLTSVESRPVTVGARRPGYVEVLTGLKEGEKIVVDGVIKIMPGGKVKIVGDDTIEKTVQSATDQAVEGKQDELKALAPDSSTSSGETPDIAPDPSSPAPAVHEGSSQPSPAAPDSVTPAPDEAASPSHQEGDVSSPPELFAPAPESGTETTPDPQSGATP